MIDEMGYLNLKPEQSNIFFKLMEERYNRRATLITTNLDYDEWHHFLGRRPMVEALLSRLQLSLAEDARQALSPPPLCRRP